MCPHVFSLCPDSHFAHEQFRNRTAQSKNSYFARQSENSHFAQDISGIVSILTLRRTYTIGIYIIFFMFYSKQYDSSDCGTTYASCIPLTLYDCVVL